MARWSASRAFREPPSPVGEMSTASHRPIGQRCRAPGPRSRCCGPCIARLRPSHSRRCGGRHVAGIVFAIALSSFAPHLAFPIGSEQFHLQLGMFSQYLILFSLGAAAGRRGWLETLSPELQRRCRLAAAIAALAMPAILLAGNFFAGGLPRTASWAGGTGRPPRRR
jgi:hypothetical protein